MPNVGRSSRYRFSENGMTIFSPSAAPRWKIATRIFRFLPSMEAARASEIESLDQIKWGVLEAGGKFSFIKN